MTCTRVPQLRLISNCHDPQPHRTGKLVFCIVIGLNYSLAWWLALSLTSHCVCHYTTSAMPLMFVRVSTNPLALRFKKVNQPIVYNDTLKFIYLLQFYLHFNIYNAEQPVFNWNSNVNSWATFISFKPISHKFTCLMKKSPRIVEMMPKCV